MSDKNIVKVSLKSLRVSPRKLGLVAGLLRGMRVNEALVQLKFSKKRCAQYVEKCLNTAIADAENNFNMDIDNLMIDTISVGKGFVMKRMRPRAKGRGMRIHKPFSHLYVTLLEQK